MAEIDISNQHRQIPIAQFAKMYHGYEKNPNDKVYHLNQTTFKGEYVTNARMKDMLRRVSAYKKANGKLPNFVWVSKPTSTSTPITITNKVCNVSTTFRMQPNNWTCGVTVLRMIASRHGLNPSYDWTVNNAWANPTNGTGHSGFRNVLKLLGFKSEVSVFRKNYSWSKIKELMAQGYDVAVNFKTGGLWDWSGNWPHWVLVQCVDDDYVWIHDPDKGASRRHDIYTMNACMDSNSNPDFVIAKYR